MAFPVILVNSATGSDTAASGAGPGTALTGVNASYVTSVVTLNVATDLSGVAVDGSHVLYLLTSTGVRFFKITAADDTLNTVTVTPNPAGTATGRTWAIGGTRASIASASSLMLFDNAGAAGDAMPGWVVQMESAHSESLTAPLTLRRAGDTTDGPIVLRGVEGAATLPLLSWNTNANAIVPLTSYIQLDNFELRNTNATKTASVAIQNTSAGSSNIAVRVTRLKIAHSTDRFWRGIALNGNSLVVNFCEIGYTASHAVHTAAGGYSIVVRLTSNYFHDTGASAVHLKEVLYGVDIRGNIIDTATDNGLYLEQQGAGYLGATTICNNTIYASGDDGIEIGGGLNTGQQHNLIDSNILKNNGGYGLNFSSLTEPNIRGLATTVRNNAFHGNTSGKYNPSTLVSTDESTLDPTFTDAANGDFKIGTNLKALGFPTVNIGATGSTRSYIDIGAAQREEPAGGGGMLRHPGMAGGTHA